jgi:hypothetical protein
LRWLLLVPGRHAVCIADRHPRQPRPQYRDAHSQVPWIRAWQAAGQAHCDVRMAAARFAARSRTCLGIRPSDAPSAAVLGLGATCSPAVPGPMTGSTARSAPPSAWPRPHSCKSPGVRSAPPRRAPSRRRERAGREASWGIGCGSCRLSSAG